MKKPQVGVWREGGYIQHAVFNIGERVKRVNANGVVSHHTVAEVIVYPQTDYLFTYWLDPNPGFEVPEDELEEAEKTDAEEN